MLRNLEIEAIFKQCQELDAQKPSFGQHSPILLDIVSEILLQ